MFTRDFLISVKRKALRKGVWYSSLDGIERGILSLAARVVERIDSAILGVELVKIIAKLRDDFKSEFVKRMETFGFRRIVEIVGMARLWGNDVAGLWGRDVGFVRFLTAMSLNGQGGFRVA